jgi:hypothetical protein
VIDRLTDGKSHHYALQWLLSDGEHEIQRSASGYGLWWRPFGGQLPESKLAIQLGLLDDPGNFSLVRADPNSTRGWRSRYYGYKEPAISVMIETNQPQVTFWSFFGFESDVVVFHDGVMHINSAPIKLTVD